MSEPASIGVASRLYDKLLGSAEQVAKSVRQHRAWAVGPSLAPTLGAVATYLSDQGGDALMALATLEDHLEDFCTVDMAATAVFAVKTGIGMRYSESQLVELGTAAFFHDLGMLDDEIFEAADRETLDREALDVLKRHPVRGRELLESQQLAPAVVTAVEQHHERWKGQGYPHKLSGEEIHPYAMIVGLCDTYEELIHRRPYRKLRMMPAQAVKQLAGSGEGAFDPAILAAFLAQWSPFPVGGFLRLSSGEVARVVGVNAQAPQRPMVEVCCDADGQPLTVPKTLDLSRTANPAVLEAIG